jgi:hypothetical protein
MNTLTLYELMGEDHEIYATLTKEGQVTVVVCNEERKVYRETSNIAAWYALVDFAKQVLYVDRHIQNELKLKDEI